MAHSPLAAALALVATAALPVFLTGSLAPELRRDFALDDAALGIAVAAYYAVSALGSAPAGRLVARIGEAAAVRLTAALVVACSLGIALLVDSAAALTALLVVGGLGNSISSPAASAILVRDLEGRRHGVGYGSLTAGAPISSLLAGLALPLVAHPLGWRATFAIGAVLAVAAALVAGVRGRDPAVAAGAAAGRPPPAPSQPQGPIPHHSEARRERHAVHTLAVATALASAAPTGLISFLVVFSVESGIGKGAAGALLAVTGLAAAVSRIGFGTLADRAPQRAPANLLALLLASTSGFLLLIAGTPVLIAVGALIAGGLGWGWAGLMSLIAVRAGRYDPAEAMGIVMTGIFLGALSGPLIVGLIASSVGFELAWIFAAASMLAAAATVAVARLRAGPERRGIAMESRTQGGADG